jgi:uncharacterized protein (DUF1330 family)
MAAYVIADVQVHDPAEYQKYTTGIPALIQKHGGEILVRGGKCEALEGNWLPSRLVIFRFPHMDAVHAFYNDPDYQPLIKQRQRSADADLLAIEGV